MDWWCAQNSAIRELGAKSIKTVLRICFFGRRLRERRLQHSFEFRPGFIHRSIPSQWEPYCEPHCITSQLSPRLKVPVTNPVKSSSPTRLPLPLPTLRSSFTVLENDERALQYVPLQYCASLPCPPVLNDIPRLLRTRTYIPPIEYARCCENGADSTI
jgi:hypothetical protein